MAKSSIPLTHERLKQVLDYSPESGIFTWRIVTSNRCKVGSAAGTKNLLGYISIKIDGHLLLAHRLAWFYVHGRWPKALIDHINGDPADNRIANLREATKSQNGSNRGMNSNNKSGFKGVRQRASGNWQAYITVGRKRISLGTYKKRSTARDKYVAAAKRYFGEFAPIS